MGLTRGTRFGGSVCLAVALALTVVTPVDARTPVEPVAPGDYNADPNFTVPALRGVTIVSVQSPATSGSPKVPNVHCPDDKQPIGVGATIGFTEDEVHIAGIVPTESSYGGGTVTVYATEDETGYDGDWYVKVIAVCAVRPPGYEIVHTYAPTTDGPTKLNGASCSAGKKLLGGGARIKTPPADRDTPVNTLPDVFLGTLGPLDDSFYATAAEDADGTSRTWSLHTYAICADPVPGRELVVAGQTYTALADDHRYQSVSCPTGTSVLSAGGTIIPADSDDEGGFSFSTVAPGSYQGSDFVAVEAALGEDELDAPHTWGLLARAVCAPVLTELS